MPNGCGVSYKPAKSGNGFRVRWREVVEEDGARKSKQHEKQVLTKKAAIELVDIIDRALKTTGTYVDPVRVIPSVPTVEALAIEYVRSLSAQGMEQSTIKTAASHIRSALARIREVLNLPEGAPVPSDRLSRELVLACVAKDRASGHKARTIRAYWKTLLTVWADGYDNHEEQGVPKPIRRPAMVLPRLAPSIAGPAPSMEEIDACIRALPPSANKARPAAIVMRYTGLRISQALTLRRSDLDTSRMLLTIRSGKSEREKAEVAAGIRQIPVSQRFLFDLAPYLADDPNDMLFRRRRNSVKGARSPRKTIRAAWEAATQAGLVRREVWNPPNRGNARPDHAFRAALLDFLKGHRIDREVRAAIVGQHDNVEAKHYADHASLIDAMREAANLLPPIDWRAAEEHPGNVVPLRAGKSS